jgi:hypothetical protein
MNARNESLKNFYVAFDGNDAWSGQLSEANATRTDGPFRTLARAAQELGPGDTCLLRQGVYRETLRPLRSGEPTRPIVFRSFPGETALLTAADELSGWTTESDGIFSASMDWDLEDQNQVFAADAMLDEARWPHRGEGDLLHPQRAAAASGSMTSLHDPELDRAAGDASLEGALLWCAGGDRWICWSEKIERYEPATQTIHFTMPTMSHWYEVRPGSRYVLMGLRSFLNAPGEWWYDEDRQRLLIIPPAGCDLAKTTIEAKRRADCIDLSGRQHVTVEGIHFRAGGVKTDADTVGIRLVRCTGTWLGHSYQRDLGAAAGVVIQGRDNAVESCELAWSSGSILRVDGCGHRIVNNYIHHGNDGAKWSGAVALRGRRILFSHNTVRHSGRDLVSVHGLMESLVQYNDLSDAGWLTCDLGMTYGHDTDFMNTVFRRNLVHDNRADGCAMGIYFDHCSHNAILQENVVYNVGDDPLRFNNPSYFNLVLDNRTYNAGKLSTFDHSHRNDLFGMQVVGNRLCQEPDLPDHVRLHDNVIADDPAAPPPAEPPWPVGHDFANPPSPIWEPADVDGMNMIRNACLELETLEFWTVRGEGTAELTKGNGWGNFVHGNAAEPTGTSHRELCLSGGPVAVEQEIRGLRPATPHTLSGWLKAGPEGGAVRLGIRHPDGREEWSVPVTENNWTRVMHDFTTQPMEGTLTVLIDKSGDGTVFCDNLGLPRKSVSLQHSKPRRPAT